jgi:outer membrane protein insertion porin family
LLPLVYSGVLLCSAAFLSAGSDSNPVEGKRVERVEFLSDGPIRGVSRTALQQLATIREGEPFSSHQARETIQRFYATERFYDVQVETELLPTEGLEVRILLIRRYLTGRIRFQGSVRLSERLLRRELTMREEEQFSNFQVEESLAGLREFYQNSGYYQATLQARLEKDAERATVDVIFEISAGEQARIRELTIDLEGPIDEGEIQNSFGLRVGDSYSEIRKDEELERLEAFFAMKGYFRADIYIRDGARYDPASNSVALILRVVPRERTDFRIEGLDWSEARMATLPIYSQRGPALVFVEETAAEIKKQLQQEGHYLASVRIDTVGGSNPATLIHVEPGDRYRVSDIRFEGNRAIDSARLEQVVSVEKKGLFSRGRLTDAMLQNDRENLRFLYQQRGYLDTQAEYELLPEGPGVAVLFRIDEGPRTFVRELLITGNEKISEAELMEEIQLREGAPFSPLALAQDRADIIARYENLGYRDVEFRSHVENLESQNASVTYVITENRQYFSDEVVIFGNLQTRLPVIEREVAIKPQSPLSLEQLLQTETNLYGLAIFNRVQVRTVDTVRDPLLKTVLVDVTEGSKYTLLYGIGYEQTLTDARSEGIRGTFGITDNNFLGMGRSLSLGLRAGSLRQRGNLSYTVPRPFGRNLPSIFSLTADNQRRVRTVDDAELLNIAGRPFDSLRLIGSSQTERRLSRRESLFFRFTFEQISLTVPDELRTPLQFFREEEELRLSSVALSYLNESRDDPADPTSGFFVSGEAQTAARPLGSNEEFFRFLAIGQYYYRAFPDLIVAASLRIGFIEPFGITSDKDVANPIPISERFFSGGPSSLRGLPQDLAGPLLLDEDGNPLLVNRGTVANPDFTAIPLGGNALMLGNLEARFPARGLVGGALFYDIGNVFPTITKIAETSFSNAVGAGVFFRTPVGPIRFDVAYNPNPPRVEGFNRWSFHVNLGHPF